MKTYEFESLSFWEYDQYNRPYMEFKSYICNELGGIFVSDIDPVKESYASVLWELGLEDDKYMTDEEFWDWIYDMFRVGDISKYCNDVHNFKVIIKEGKY